MGKYKFVKDLPEDAFRLANHPDLTAAVKNLRINCTDESSFMLNCLLVEMIRNGDLVIIPTDKPMTLTEIYTTGKLSFIVNTISGGERVCYFYSSLDQYKKDRWYTKLYPVMFPLSVYIQLILDAEGIDAIGIDPETGQPMTITDKKSFRELFQEANREDADEE